MKSALALFLSLMMCSAWAADFAIIKTAPTKKLTAFKGPDSSDYKVGQELVLKSSDGIVCRVSITKILPEKSIYFMNTEKCIDSGVLVANTRFKSEVEDSFPLDDEKKPERREEYADSTSNLPSMNESWYTYWAIGYAKPTYADDVQAELDTIKAMDGVKHYTFDLDLFGFYWPLANKKTMLGFIINGSIDDYKISDSELKITQYLYGASGMHFFGPNIGSGWFLRGDVGIAKFKLEASGSGVTESSTSESGFGVLLGGGYAWPITSGTRLLLNGNFAHRSVKDDKVNTMMVNIGLLF